MEAAWLLLILCFWGLFIFTPIAIACTRGHKNTLAISACAVIGGVLTPFLLPALLWIVALIWSLTSTD